MNNQAPTITVHELSLRKPEEKDIMTRYLYGRPKEFRKMCGGNINHIPPFTKENTYKWYERICEQPCEWIIEYQDKMIGTARLTLKGKDLARYAIGIYDESLYNQGIGTTVTKTVLDYAFNTLDVEIVELMVLEFNHRAIKCYEKCGFIKKQVIENNACIDGVYYNDIMMEIDKEYFNG